MPRLEHQVFRKAVCSLFGKRHTNQIFPSRPTTNGAFAAFTCVFPFFPEEDQGWGLAGLVLVQEVEEQLGIPIIQLDGPEEGLDAATPVPAPAPLGLDPAGTTLERGSESTEHVWGFRVCGFGRAWSDLPYHKGKISPMRVFPQ